MRLVDICEFFSDFGGGVRTYVHQKLEACANEGWEATIIAPGPADRREKRLGGEIIWVRSPTLAFDHRYHLFARSKPVHDLLDELNPTVIEGLPPGEAAGSPPSGGETLRKSCSCIRTRLRFIRIRC